jgi:hypothetical protein
MGKELRDGREFFDGDPIELYEGRFSGSFEIDSDSGASMSHGDLVTFIVTARVDSPKFSHVRNQGLKRSNTMKVVSAVAMDADKARFLYDNAGMNVSGVNDGIIESKSIDVPDVSIDEIIVQDNIFHSIGALK